MAEAKLTQAAARALLFRAPLAEFVAERKRLAAALKSAGDKEGATALATVAKPSASAWVVNQLYWQARPDFDAMLATAAKLRHGELSATGAHREAMSKLRARAARLLEENGHTATEPLLRRATTTLAALAATGGFEPDLPGELATDRDPPGFEAAEGLAARPSPGQVAKPTAPPAKLRLAPSPPHHDELAHARRAAEAKRLAEAAGRRQAEEKRRAAERLRLTIALDAARKELRAAEQEVATAKKALASAEASTHKIRAAEEKLVAQLASLADAATSL